MKNFRMNDVNSQSMNYKLMLLNERKLNQLDSFLFPNDVIKLSFVSFQSCCIVISFTDNIYYI